MAAECSVWNCNRAVRAGGLCGAHWQMQRKRGYAEWAPATRTERFWSKFVRDGGCWVWTGCTMPNGYGKFGVGQRSGGTVLAHRFAYELLVGPIPAGLQLDHLCRNRACVNPAHLEPVTCAENLRRGAGSARATHCKWGHALTGENVYVTPGSGKRNCATCKRLRRLPNWREGSGMSLGSPRTTALRARGLEPDEFCKREDVPGWKIGFPR